MEKLTPEQIHNWRRIMSTMGMSMISSIVSDEEVEKFAKGIQHRVSIMANEEREVLKRSIEESNKVVREAVQISGFKNTIRVVKGK